MRFYKSVLCSLLTMSIVATCIATFKHQIITPLYAHDVELNVTYDSCEPSTYISENSIGDGENETWYALFEPWEGKSHHLPNSSNTTEVKYYINDVSPSGDVSWNDITCSTRREYVKNTFINSICKWNNVYFYKQSSLNRISKHKLVSISEGTLSNHNLVIYPEGYNAMYGNYAICSYSEDESIYIGFQNGVEHYHTSNWTIRLRLSDHLTQSDESDFVLNMTGAHEFGHALGLKDVDHCENMNHANYHHEEILMGYSKYEQNNNNVMHRQSEITYKDLIGAAITRGYHTDLDHKWMLHSCSNNEYKIICSICNGVKYVSSLDGIDYVDYKDCNDEHDLADGNMFAVASYGSSDYYKCKYCRYVAPFTAIVEQDYDYEEYSNTQHLVTNQIEGLEYSFYEDHTFDTTHTCTLCDAQYAHSYTHHYENYSLTLHKAYCECGAYDLTPHATSLMNSYFYNGHLYAPCMFCGALVDLGGTGPIVPGQGLNDLMVTDNGSYIMPNGIYVIIEEDLEAFLNSALIFHPYGEVGA